MSNIPLSERRHWIGSSEAAVLLGASPYQSYYDLWQEKAGHLERESRDDDERIQAGRFLEPAIAAWANAKWDLGLTKVDSYIPHPTVGGMGASWDFRTPEGQPAEVKNVDTSVFRDEWAAESDIITDAPIHILTQAQHQMACGGPEAVFCWLIVCVGGNRLLRMRIERHEAMVRALEEATAEFWAEVRGGVAPPPDFSRDARALGRLLAVSNGRYLDLRADDRLPPLCGSYLLHRGHETHHKGEAQKVRAELLSIIGLAENVAATGYRISAATQERDGKPFRVIRITKER